MRAGAVCVEATALCLLYGLVVCALKITHSWPDFREGRYSAAKVCLFLAITLFSTYFVFRKVANDHTVYYFDSRNYWARTIFQSDIYLGNPFEALKIVYSSILQDDYNTFICLFMALPVQLLGKSYVAFVMAIQMMFNLPTLWILSTAGQKLLAKCDVRAPWLLCYFVAALCPTIFFPSGLGYPDSLALIFAAMLLLLAIDLRWQKPQISHVAVMGAILPLCMITRRYFSFFIVNFAIMLTIYGLVEVLSLRKRNRRTLLRAISAYAAVGLLSLGILLVFFRPMLEEALNNDYRVAFSAYNSGQLTQQFGRIYSYNGGVIILPALFGAALGILKRRTRGFSLGLALGTLASCMLFFRIQDMGTHHLLLVSCSLILFMILLVGFLAYGIDLKSWGRIALFVAGGGMLLVNFTMGWTNVPMAANPLGLFTTYKVLSRQRNDFEALHNLAACANAQKGKVYLLSCCDALNTDTLRYLDYPYKENAVENQYTTHDIDLRDGFPEAFFDSNVIISIDPLRLDHGAENQRVIGALAQHFIDGTGFARHYERLESFQLDGGITATVYRRFEDWTLEDYDALREEFNGYYPDYPELFADRIHP